MTKARIAILASGSGTNAEEIIKHFNGHSSVTVSLVLSNNPQAFVLERAKKFKIPFGTFGRQEFKEAPGILPMLYENKITHIVLAGFLWLIPDYLITAYPEKIINIHPALLPKYGGKGMYGSKVHEAVRAANEVETGITIHVVNEHYDEGRILFQASCGIGKNFTPDDIAKCVHQLEYTHYPRVIDKWINS
jgi:phosphoribosylglycinamide formyltransferase 1